MFDTIFFGENEIRDIYENNIPKDFHESEIKPLKKIYAMRDEGNYSCVGFFKNKVLNAYAFVCYKNERDYILLDYFAVSEKLRGNGIGRECLKGLNDIFGNSKGIILETEDPAFSFDDTDMKIRNKRIEFYEKNGFVRHNISSSIYRANYIIMSRRKDRIKDKDDNIYKYTEKIYKVMFSENEYRENVVLKKL
ncbi:MAG: GNAT family N-acetyltransferase [Firmicutes bacterium]|nr:GNAT family N-acetyltransferase [Bacillota bacterium]